MKDPAIASSAFIQRQATIIGQTLPEAPFLAAVPADAGIACSDGFAKLRRGDDPTTVGKFIVDEHDASLANQ